jgi:choice-of-anchor A domain-containing protein
VKFGLVLSVALLACAPAHSTTLMTAKDFNLFVLNDATVGGSDTEGRVAVGRDATFTPYSVALKAPSNTVNLVVGRNLNYTNDTFKGSMVIGGNATISGVGVTSGNINANGNLSYSNGTINGNLSAHGTVTTSGASFTSKTSGAATVTLPVDFVAEKTRLTTLSTLYSTYNGGNLPSGAVLGTAVTSNGGGTVTLTGSGSGINVFNISASMLSGSNTFNINLTGGGVALVNVSGTSPVFTGGMNFNGSANDSGGANTLFNFYQAQSLDTHWTAFLGSILAPLATYAPAGYGHIAGQVVVNNWTDSNNGRTQVNNIFLRDYAVGKNLLGDPVPTPPRQAAVPEPSTWMTMVAGFGLLGGALRRSRRKPALA